jgi:cellulase/cellobiase CelA1
VTADVAITNTGAIAVNGWALTFTLPGDTHVTNAWNATVTQNGHLVTATSVAYNATIPAGGGVSFGFQGAWTSSDANPTGFALNGADCTAS